MSRKAANPPPPDRDLRPEPPPGPPHCTHCRLDALIKKVEFALRQLEQRAEGDTPCSSRT